MHFLVLVLKFAYYSTQGLPKREHFRCRSVGPNSWTKKVPISGNLVQTNEQILIPVLEMHF